MEGFLVQRYLVWTGLLGMAQSLCHSGKIKDFGYFLVMNKYIGVEIHNFQVPTNRNASISRNIV